MQICKSISEMRAWRAAQTGTVALVPTMGALHAGHLSLVALGATHAAHVVASIFVNPTQFENPDDLAAYPNSFDEDCAALKAAGVACVFAPQAGDIYPDGAETIVETTRLANILHGLTRPGHFRGVATVVTKLFNIVTPDFATFGEKDYQQLQVIRRMVSDLHLPVTILPAPTVREDDGLAMSSRNRRLMAQDRKAALVLSASLDLAEQMVAQGTDIDRLHAAVEGHIAGEPRASRIVVDIAEADTLAPVTGPVTAPIALMISAQFGEVLLIDQRVATP